MTDSASQQQTYGQTDAPCCVAPMPPETLYKFIQSIMDASVVLSQETLSMRKKQQDFAARASFYRVMAYNTSSLSELGIATDQLVDVREYIPPTNYYYPEKTNDTSNIENKEDKVGQPLPKKRPHILLLLPFDKGFYLLPESTGVIDITDQHHAAFHLIQLTTSDGSLAFRLTFIDNKVMKKIEPIFYKENGLTVHTSKQPMVFADWPRLLSSLKGLANTLLYVSLSKSLFLNPRPVVKKRKERELKGQVWALVISCQRYSHDIGILEGAIADSANIEQMLSDRGIIKGNTLRLLEEPSLDMILTEMDNLFHDVDEGDIVFVYYSGLARRLKKEGISEGTDPFGSEPVVGLMPTDAKNTNGMNEICDLTNIWFRWWCNALYLVKNVSSVVVVLDTSFEDPKVNDPQKLRYCRSYNPLYLGPYADIRKLPAGIQPKSWFHIGQALELPLFSQRILDIMTDYPVAFGPSPAWAQKHVIIQACRDNQIVTDKPFFQSIEQPYEGCLTHFLCQHLKKFVPDDDDEQAPEEETYLELLSSLSSYCKSPLYDQQFVYFIGEARKYDQFLKPVKRIPNLGGIKVEAASGPFGVLSCGFAAYPADTTSFAQFENDSPAYAIQQLDPVISVVAAPSPPFTVPVGESLQPCVLDYHKMTLVVPSGTSNSDPELYQVASQLNQELKELGIVPENSPLEEQSASWWPWQYFKRPNQPNSSNFTFRCDDSYIKNVITLGTVLRDKTDAKEIISLVDNYMQSLQKQLAANKFVTLDTNKDYNHVITLQRLTSWLLERAETKMGSELETIKKAISGLLQATDIVAKEKNQPKFRVTVCRNETTPPTANLALLRRNFGLASRLLAPVGFMVDFILDINHGEIYREACSGSASQYLEPNYEKWSIASTNIMQNKATYYNLYWNAYYSFIAGLDCESDIIAAISKAEVSAMTDVSISADLAQVLVLYGVWYLSRRQPLEAIYQFNRAKETLREAGLAYDEKSFLLNEMVAYAMAHQYDEAASLLKSFMNSTSSMTINKSLACLYTVIKLTEFDNGQMIMKDPGLFKQVVKCFITTFTRELNSQNQENQPSQIDSLLLLRTIFYNNLALFFEAVGDFAQADALYKAALQELTLWKLPFKQEHSPLSITKYRSLTTGLQQEIAIVIVVNRLLLASQLLQSSVSKLTEAAITALADPDNQIADVLEAAHILSALNKQNFAHKIYSLICLMPKRKLELAKNIARYHLKTEVTQFRGNADASNLHSLPQLLVGGLFAELLCTPDLTKQLDLPKPINNYVVDSEEGITEKQWSVFGGVPQDLFKRDVEKYFMSLITQTNQITPEQVWKYKATLVVGAALCYKRQHTSALSLLTQLCESIHKRVVELIDPLKKKGRGPSATTPTIDRRLLDRYVEQEKRALPQIDIIADYIRYLRERSLFFLAAIPPYEVDAQLTEPDQRTGATTFLCPPMEHFELAHVAMQWYWRNIKIDSLVKLNYYASLGVKIGAVEPAVAPLGYTRTDNKKQNKKDPPVVGPLEMHFNIVTKVNTAVPRTASIHLHDTERIEMGMQVRKPIPQKIYNECIKQSPRQNVIVRYRFHVVDFRSDGSVKLLTRGANMTGHSINIPCYDGTAKPINTRLGSITTQHLSMEKYYQNSIYYHHPPLSHIFVVMIADHDEYDPPMLDFRYFEQGCVVDVVANAYRALIQHDYQKLRVQTQLRLMNPGVINGNTWHGEWLRIRSIPNPNDKTRAMFDRNLEMTRSWIKPMKDTTLYQVSKLLELQQKVHEVKVHIGKMKNHIDEMEDNIDEAKDNVDDNLIEQTTVVSRSDSVDNDSSNKALEYCTLAISLPDNNSITLADGTEMTKQQLLLKAIDLDPSNSHAYLHLSTTFPINGSITLMNGITMTKQQLLLKVIDLDPSYALAYLHLSTTLPKDGSIRLLDGTTMTKQQLLLKGIDLDPFVAAFYYILSTTLPNDGSITLLNGTTMTKQQLLLKAIKLGTPHSLVYLHLATTLPNDGTITLSDGTTMTKQELLLKAIDLDPSNSHAYNNLATTLPDDGSITLLNGTTMTKQELLLKAIDLDPSYSYAYNNLAATLPNNGSIRLLDGTTMTMQQLLLKAIDLDPSNSYAYYNLATTLPNNGSIELVDGTTMTTQQLYLKAIDLDPSNSAAYNNLACTLPDNGSITLLNGTTMEKAQLLRTAIKFNKQNSFAFNNLACILHDNDPTKSVTHSFFLRAIANDPYNSHFYFNLATTLPNDGSITLLDRTTMTKTLNKQQLLLKAIELGTSDSLVYLHLAATLPNNGSITLSDGTTITTQELLLKAIDLDPSNLAAYSTLASLLPNNGSITLLDGTTMTTQQLLLKAQSELNPSASVVKQFRHPMFRLMYSIGTRNSHTLFLQGQSAGTTNLGEYLSEALKINSTLTQLDLSGNRVGAEGVKYLSESLKISSTLTHLDLSCTTGRRIKLQQPSGFGKRVHLIDPKKTATLHDGSAFWDADAQMNKSMKTICQ